MYVLIILTAGKRDFCIKNSLKDSLNHSRKEMADFLFKKKPKQNVSTMLFDRNWDFEVLPEQGYAFAVYRIKQPLVHRT